MWQPDGSEVPAAVRSILTNGWRGSSAGVRWFSVLVSNAPDALLAVLGHVPIRRTFRDIDRMLATLYAYDRRGGAAETQFK